MKVVCINGNDMHYLSRNKIYDVLYSFDDRYYDGMYNIRNDNDVLFVFPKTWFTPLSEIREEKLNQLLCI
jgi:hypothetical protein